MIIDIFGGRIIAAKQLMTMLVVIVILICGFLYIYKKRQLEGFLAGPLDISCCANRFAGELDPAPQWNGKGWSPDGVIADYDPEMIMSLSRAQVCGRLAHNPRSRRVNYLEREFSRPVECDNGIDYCKAHLDHCPISSVSRDKLPMGAPVHVNAIGLLYGQN